MTSSIGGGAVNLATLWVPVLPEVSGFASKLAEGVVGGATMAVVNKFLDVMGGMVSKTVEGLGEIAKGVIEIGEQFQTLEYQVASFTDAQGAALESLKNTASQVFAQLDTGTNNLGQNLDVFHQRLGLTGEGLRKLTYDYTELQSRLGNLDVRAFTANLDAFGVTGDKADAALRTLAADSQHYGDTLSELNATMSTAEPTFSLLGISYNAAAEASAKLNALGPNAMKVMNGLAMSGKEFAKLPTGSEDFKKFINDTIDAINYYHSHGEDSKAESLAATMFGSRQWAIVLRSLGAIKDAMDGVGDAGRQLNVDKFVEDTRKLDQMWELFIHRLEFDLKPVGDAALQGLEAGVHWLGDFLSAHEGEIVTKIQGWGDAFIQALPGIQRFAGEAIRILGDFFQFMNVGTQAMLSDIGLIMQGWGWLTNNPNAMKAGQSLVDMANELNKVDLSKFTDGLANLIEAPNIDANAIQKKWDEAMGRVRDHANESHGGLGGGLSVHIDPKAPDGSPLTNPKQLLPPPDAGGLHLPVTLDPSNPNANTPPPKTANDQLPWYLNPGKVLNPDWYLSKVFGSGNKTQSSASGETTPGIVHTGDPGDPVHVALTAGSTPLPVKPQPGPGGWGKGGGGPDHSANQGYGSTGSSDGNVYDAPTDPRNQLPGANKQKSPDPGDLIGPLFDALGFGNVLGSPNPENLGIVKLLKGVISWMNTPPGGASGAGGSSGGTGADILGLGKVNTGPHTMLDDVLGKLFPGYGGGPGGPGPGGPAPGGPGGAAPHRGGHTPWWPPKPATSYDQGGTLLPGDTNAINQTGKPEVVLPPGAAWVPANPTTGQNQQLAAILKTQGFSDSEITGLIALNSVETGNWAHPESIMGITDNQSGPGMGPHVQKFKNMWDARQKAGAVPPLGQPGTGVDANGNVTDPGKYANWLLKMEGYSPTTDWQGNKYAPGQFLSPQDYASKIQGAFVPGAPGGAPALKSLFGPTGAAPGGGPAVSVTPSGSGGAVNLSTVAVAAQKFADDCIDASARIILSHSGINMTEEQLKSVITPGGSIDSLTAGLNQLDPQGKFMAMQGSGGSQQKMYDAIKASVDKGAGSVLNVAPGSSLAGHTFAPGHFIAVTGYNPDGTINVSDTATGRVYSVTQADAFQATQGRGIVAGTGIGPPPMGVSAGPNVAPGGGGQPLVGAGGVQIHGDYMPINVAPSAIDPKPAVKAMQDQQNSLFGSAGGGPGALPR